MKTTFSTTAASGIRALTMALASALAIHAAHAEERRDQGRQDSYRSARPDRSPQGLHDDRHHHGRDYPAFGHVVPRIPPEHIALSFSRRRLFFQAGVWYEPTARGYVVVRPPAGIVIPILPPSYSTVWIAGVPYYQANDIYYSPAPGGYAVANPPADVTYIEAPAPVTSLPPPPPPPAPHTTPPASAVQAAPQASGGTWYYCNSSRAYYPYVTTCDEDWKLVPATP